MFGEAVRTHRLRNCLTQEELTAATGLGIRTIRNLEAGRINRPRPSTVRILADIFQLDGGERDRFQQLALMRSAGQTETEAPEPAYPPPRQLPSDTVAFTGREPELTELGRRLSGDYRVPAVAIVTISGIAGVGKPTTVF